MHRTHFAVKHCRLAIAMLSIVALSIGLAAPRAHAEDVALQHAREFLKKHPLIDGHNDLPDVIRKKGTPPRDVIAYDLTRPAAGDTDIARLRAGGVGGQFWSVWVPSSPETGKQGFARLQLEQIDIALRMIERYPDDLALALTADDVERANAAGKIASLLGMEGGHVLENSLGALRDYYRLGVRYMTLTHFNANDWADSATEPPRHQGLSKFGVEVVREMNRLGMLVDLSHVSEETMNDALDASEAPVIFSHSTALAVTPSPRNVSDAVLARMRTNGGVVMANFISKFTVRGEAHARWQEAFERETGAGLADTDYAKKLAAFTAKYPEPRATITDVADHVEHLRDVAGADHVGIGADFFGEPPWMAAGLEDVSCYPQLFAELIRRGWSDSDLEKLARGNVLRVLREAEKVAARLQKERPASYATIEQVDAGKVAPDGY